MSTSRQVTWQGPPRPGDVTEDFPACVAPDACLRAHSADYGPGWFASVDRVDSPLGGRFDLVATVDDEGSDEWTDLGRGTLYCANDLEAALRERLGEAFAGRRFIAASELHDTSVSVVYTAESGLGRCLADTFNATGILTREISVMSDYEVTRAWALEFDGWNFDGLAYEPRSTPGVNRIAFALFGPAGPAPWLTWSPHPTWWQEIVDSGIVHARVSGRKARILH